MNTTIVKIVIMFTLSLVINGCVNNPTNPSQITGAYVSSIKYEQYDCSRLTEELNSLSRRENQLVNAQNNRINSSQMQVLVLGYGSGDSIEASELANVRGEREAVRKAMGIKGCKI